MPADKRVTTTWHDDESVEEVFYFALNSALPFSPLIKSIIILDITDEPNEHKMLARFKTAQDELEKDQNYNAVSGAIAEYGNKFVKASGGTLVERLNIMMPILFFGFLCLLLWGLVDFLWPRLVHFLS